MQRQLGHTDRYQIITYEHDITGLQTQGQIHLCFLGGAATLAKFLITVLRSLSILYMQAACEKGRLLCRTVAYAALLLHGV